MIFAWNEWNLGHIAEHGVSAEEAEYVVRRARRPYPMSLDAEKRLVIGRTANGRLLHVIFVFKTPNDVEPGSISSEVWAEIEEAAVVQVIFVIHAMPASQKIVRQDRKRRRKGR